MELMRDGDKRIPFDAALRPAASIDEAAKRHGLMRTVGALSNWERGGSNEEDFKGPERRSQAQY
jgi:hypothetical protein